MEKITNGITLRELIRTLEKKLGIIEENNKSDCCLGITFAQCHAITEIGRAKQLTINDLAFALNMDKGAMSRAVKDLVEKGFAQREVDERDRRYVAISLTKKGEEKYNSIQSDMQKYFDKILSNIPEKKQEQVFESLMLLNQAIPDGK